MIVRPRIIAAFIALTALSGCASWFGGQVSLDKKPTPLAVFAPIDSLKVSWSQGVGGADEGVFAPAVRAGWVYASGEKGHITEIDLETGRTAAQIDVPSRLSGGVGVGRDHVYAVTRDAELLSVSTDGKENWRKKLSSLPVGVPLESAGRVFVQTQNGYVTAFDSQSGQQLWVFQRSQPALQVHHAGSFSLVGAEVGLLGLSNGRMAVLNLATGELLWEAIISSPRGATELERVADVATPPVFDSGLVCAAAYQGRLTCLDARSGTPLWSKDVASSRGLVMDSKQVYITSDDGVIFAFDRQSGAQRWQQVGLRWRGVSAPVLLDQQVFVYDNKGYAHLLDRDSGAFRGQISTGGGEMLARPVSLGDRVVIQTRAGQVMAITK